MSARSLALDPTNLSPTPRGWARLSARATIRGHRDVETGARLARAPARQRALASRRRAAILGHGRRHARLLGSDHARPAATSACSCSGGSRRCASVSTPERGLEGPRRRGGAAAEHADALTIWIRRWISVAFARAGETARPSGQEDLSRRLPEGRASGTGPRSAQHPRGRARHRAGRRAPTRSRGWRPRRAAIHAIDDGGREQKDAPGHLLGAPPHLDHPREVIALAQERLRQNPDHLSSLAALAWAHGTAARPRAAAGVGASSCRRAEAIGLAPTRRRSADAARRRHRARHLTGKPRRRPRRTGEDHGITAAVLHDVDGRTRCRTVELDPPRRGEGRVQGARRQRLPQRPPLPRRARRPSPARRCWGTRAPGTVVATAGRHLVKPGDHVILACVPNCGHSPSVRDRPAIPLRRARAPTGKLFDDSSRLPPSRAQDLFAHMGRWHASPTRSGYPKAGCVPAPAGLDFPRWPSSAVASGHRRRQPRCSTPAAPAGVRWR